jgi:hypothetical protein
MSNYSQLLIDLVEEIEDLLDPFDITDVNYTSLEAKIYYIENILEIIDPERISYIEILNNLIKILEEQIKVNETT